MRLSLTVVMTGPFEGRASPNSSTTASWGALPPPLVPCSAFFTGKSVDVLSPAMCMLPRRSTAMPRPDSLPEPPMNVENSRADPAALISVTNMSNAIRVV